ncbi:MAG: hypothetical protein HC945_01565, partial [Nitrosarchaeum sp.]|nr:hypothetical protein [Nitrosarchaeum sp.]
PQASATAETAPTPTAATAQIIVEGGVGTLSEMTYCYLNQIPTVVMENVPGVGIPYIGKYMDKRKLIKILGTKEPARAVQLIMETLRKNDVLTKVKSIEHIRQATRI